MNDLPFRAPTACPLAGSLEDLSQRACLFCVAVGAKSRVEMRSKSNQAARAVLCTIIYLSLAVVAKPRVEMRKKSNRAAQAELGGISCLPRLPIYGNYFFSGHRGEG